MLIGYDRVSSATEGQIPLVNNIAGERIIFDVFEYGLGVFEGLRGRSGVSAPDPCA